MTDADLFRTQILVFFFLTYLEGLFIFKKLLISFFLFPGSRYARLQVKVGLAWLLHRFTLAEQSPYPVKFEKSIFGLRDPTAFYDLIPRKV